MRLLYVNSSVHWLTAKLLSLLIKVFAGWLPELLLEVCLINLAPKYLKCSISSPSCLLSITKKMSLVALGFVCIISSFVLAELISTSLV